MLNIWMGFGAIVGIVMYILMEIDFEKEKKNSDLPPSLENDNKPSFIFWMICGIIGGPIFAVWAIYAYIDGIVTRKKETKELEIAKEEASRIADQSVKSFILTVSDLNSDCANSLTKDTAEKIYKASIEFQKIGLSRFSTETLKDFQKVLIYGRKSIYSVYDDSEQKKSDRIAKNLTKSLTILSKNSEI
jgi:hypothetical protein